MDLAKFLNARLDDDQWVAEGAARTDDRRQGAWYPAMFGPGGFDARVDDHLARHDPGRVLREVDAKRKIVAEHAMEPGMFPPSCVRCCDTNTAQYPQRWDALMWPCPTVRALAAVWSDHEDYDPAWKE